MLFSFTIRRVPLAATALLALSVLVPTHLVAAPRQGRWHDAPPTSHNARPSSSPRSSVGPRPGQQHLPEWLNQHQELSPAEQQRALDREPGFHQLPPEVQQRMHSRLSQLDSMPPAQRQRVVNRTEAIERLAPEQRQQIRGSMQQLSSLPPDQRHDVTRAFRQYRSLSPEQRQTALSSGQLTTNLSPQERSTFNTLVTVEPLLPPAPTQHAPQ